MPRLKCPRGCVPESALAGYIDNHGLDLTWRHIWLSPGGDDISVVDHEDYAIRHGADGRFPNLIFERMGWIRVSLLQGTIGIEMETEPTAAQLETLDKYLSYPGMVFKTATFRNRYLQVEGFQRVTAGRIAAWVDAQGSGALGALKARRYIERHLHLDLIPSLAVWIRPGDGVDFGGIDHEKFARERMQKGFFGDAIQELELQGWIRITGYHGSISIELRVPPTNAQMRTLSDYLNSPGITVQMVSDGANTTNILRPDGATRMTAGRIAAWAAQQAPGGLGGTRAPKASHVGGCFDWVAYAARPFEFVFRLSDGNCGPEHRGVFADYMDTFEAHFEGYDDFKPAYTAVYAEAQRRFGTAKNAAFYRWPELLPPVTVRPFSTSPLAVVARSWGYDDRGPEHVDALVTAMKRRSLLPPVITFGASMEDGRHRVLAAAKLGLSVVPGWDINVLAQRVLQMYGPR